MYPDKTTDKIMIPQWEYRKLRDIATRADMLRAEIEYEKKSLEDNGHDWEPTMRVSKIERIMAFNNPKQYTNDIRDVETLDTLSDALGYTE